MKKITIIGSDARYDYAARELERLGFDVITRADSGSDAVLIPINQRGGVIKTQHVDVLLSEVARICSRAVFFGGAENDDIRRALGDRRFFDITQNAEFAEENAELTAEGALGIIIDKMPFSVRGAKVHVLGYGRVGRATTNALVSLGALVTVFARSDAAREAAGKTCNTRDFSCFDVDFDCLINTVPTRVLKSAAVRQIGDCSYVIELASAPGGFDDDDISSLGARYINAPGLPGKTSPASAGKIMAKAIYDIIKGEENK